MISRAPTLSPLEIEQRVAYPIEQVYTGLPHPTEVRSRSKFGLSMVTVVFSDGTDISFASQLVMECIFYEPNDLLDGVPSNLGSISTGRGEICQEISRAPIAT